MKFKEWKEWYRSLPKSMRWFVILIFIRPIIDNFYYLKKTSPFLSPLYIAGILTPLLIIYSVYNKKKPLQTAADKSIRFWGGILLLGIVVMGLDDLFSLEYLGTVLKIIFPVYLFIFTRHFIRNLKDLEGVMQIFLYSSIIIIGFFLFEVVFHPLNLEYSRDLERIRGEFSSIFIYATYLILCTLISFYFFLKPDSTLSFSRRLIFVIITLILAVAMLFKISHTASYGVFASLILIFILIYFKRNAIGGLIFVSIGLVLFYMYGQETIDTKLAPLVATDIRAVSGEIETTHMLHGRVGRWEDYLAVFNNSSLPVQLFGFPVGMPKPYLYITVAPHNDFLRILFNTGYIGLIAYILFLYFIFRRVIRHNLNILYVGLGALSCIILYSISSVPTFYTSFMYIIFSIFAFFALPLKTRVKAV